MDKTSITNGNGENDHLEEQDIRIVENNNSNLTHLSRWPNRIIALTAIGTLIVTCALAFFTYRSLDEVKKQRNLTYKQFVMANRPNVNIGLGSQGGGLKLNKKIGYIEWRIGNDGGDVQDLRYKTVLFHMKSESKSDLSIDEFYVRNLRQKNLNKGTRNLIRNSIQDVKTLRKITEILAMDERSDRIGLYIRVEYTIPAELTVDGAPRKDNRFFILAWSKTRNSFELVKPAFFEIITQKLSVTNLNSTEDRG